MVGVDARGYGILRYFGFVVMRVRSDNPGIWLVHCHMDYHLASGMGFALDIRQVCDVVRSPDDTRHFSTHFSIPCVRWHGLSVVLPSQRAAFWQLRTAP